MLSPKSETFYLGVFDYVEKNKESIPDAARSAMLTFLKGVYVEIGPVIGEPDATFADHRSLLLVWELGNHYIEVETGVEGRFELFYRNEDTGAFWGDEAVDVKAAQSSFITLVRERVLQSAGV